VEAGAVHASTSAIRLMLSTVALISTLILFVLTAENVTCRQTLLFPVMLPPGTVTHALPFQYCTSKPGEPIETKGHGVGRL